MEAWGAFLSDAIDAIRNVRIEAWQAILIGAAGTWIIALIAVGDRLIKPKLRVRKQGFSPNISHHDNVAVRYYLVQASNSRRRFRTAHEVQLIITRIERQVGNVRQTIWDEIMPLSWV